MVFNAHLSGDGHSISNLSTTADTHLGNDDTALTDIHIVADVDQTIYFRTSPDSGHPPLCPVNRHIRSNLDFVFNNDPAGVSDPFVTRLSLIIAEPAPANCTPGTDHNITTDIGAIENRRKRVDDRSGADADPVANIDQRIDCCVRGDAA